MILRKKNIIIHILQRMPRQYLQYTQYLQSLVTDEGPDSADTAFISRQPETWQYPNFAAAVDGLVYDKFINFRTSPD